MTNVVSSVCRLVGNPGTLVVLLSILSLVVSLMLVSFTGGMLLRTLNEVARGVTANEDIRDKWKGRNPYDLGCWRNYIKFLCKPIGPSILERGNYHNKSRLII
eukprot:TRINITY_DN3197_c0_g2_i6.p2 TRINITY_DN3197_c0_g2~~TRINITY_DN3197_c0_g2_i6.p2  ORF type:complete len:103 (-),score=13.28 TRINITY_DN3197_c0_g2_i6:125-433(-)